MTVRLGVLGCADIAVRRVLPALGRGVPGLELSVVASRTPQRAAGIARRFGAAPVIGYDALLTRDDVDAVYVPVPTALHARWVEAALLSDKHVLVEKPMTTRLALTRHLLALARERGLVVVENVMSVHHGQHRAVAGLVADGVVGEMRCLTAEFVVPRPASGHHRFRADLGGGALHELAIYPVQAALQFLGPDLEVAGVVRTVPSGQEVDTMGAALLRGAGGVPAHLSYGIDHAYRCSYQVVGDRGRIELDRAFTPPAEHPPVLRISDATGSWREQVLAPQDQVALALAAFAGVVRGDAPWPTDEIERRAALLDRLSCDLNTAKGSGEAL
jgi:predicted dehydrogenase